MRAPIFIPGDASAPARSLCVDGAVIGAAATYSHWVTAPATPVELLADTSTGMCLRAAADAERWLAPYASVVNNHVDADGLLSTLAACRPDLALGHAERMEAAAACGDFATWMGADAYRLVLCLHQRIRACQQGGGDWEQAAMSMVVTDAERILASAYEPDPERDAAVLQVETTIERLRQGDGVHLSRYPGLAVVRWRAQHGHTWDRFLDVYREDDLPVQALSTVIDDHCWQLLLMEHSYGLDAVLEAPRHSWARTVQRPAVAWPHLAATADALQRLDRRGTWRSGDGARETAFTALLACTGVGSNLAPEVIIEHVIAALQPRSGPQP